MALATFAALLSPTAYLSHMATAPGDVAAKAFIGESPLFLVFRNSAQKGKNCCLNASTVELFLKNKPQSTSTKNLVHLAQTVRDGMLTKYDYGNANFNVAHYGESKAPPYNLANIPHDLPIFLSYGGQDALSDVKDVETLLDSLKFHDVDKLHVQYIKDYAHADFITGVTAIDLVYNQIVAFSDQTRISVP